MQSTPMIRAKLLLIVFVGLAVLIGIAYVGMHKAATLPVNQVACTMEAKICPDGSSVGRQGPSCQFAECSTISPTTGWKTYTDTKVAFMYPETLGTKYIMPQVWPPEVSITKGTFVCNATGTQITAEGQTAVKSVDSKALCVTVSSEGAAGSTYTTYTYRTERNGEIITVKFVLRYPQCLNYDDPQKTECQDERSVFDIDTIAGRIALSAKSQ